MATSDYLTNYMADIINQQIIKILDENTESLIIRSAKYSSDILKMMIYIIANSVHLIDS